MNTNVLELLKKGKPSKEKKAESEVVKESHEREIKLLMFTSGDGFTLAIDQRFLKSNPPLRREKGFKITFANVDFKIDPKDGTQSLETVYQNILPRGSYLEKYYSADDCVLFQGIGSIKPLFILHEYLESGDKNARGWALKSWACKTRYAIKEIKPMSDGSSEVTLEKI